MILLVGLALTAVFAGCVAYVSEKSNIRPERVAIRLFNGVFKELFYEVIFGARPNPWTINWATVSYSRYKFSDDLKKKLKDLAYLDYMRCKDYSTDMTHDVHKLPFGINKYTYTPIPHMLRQGFRWHNLYDPVRWRYIYFSWYQHTVLKRVKMDRELEQRWKYEVYMQQPRKGGLYQKCFGERLPPNNYPHKKLIFDYLPDYDMWFGPSHNNPRYWRIEPRGHQYWYIHRFLDFHEDDPKVHKVWWTIEGIGHGGIHPYDYDEDGNLKQRTFYPVDFESEGEYMGEQSE